MQDRGPTRIDPNVFFWFGVLFEAALVVVASVISWIVDGDPFPFDDSFRVDVSTVLAAIGWTIPLAIYARIATSDWGLRFAPLRGIHDKVREHMGPSVVRMRVWQLFALSLAAGIGEEFLFRGVLQEYWGVGTTSLVFGLLHALTPAYFFLTFAMGALLGSIYELSEHNLALVSLIHFGYDFVVFVLLKKRFIEKGEVDLDPPPSERDAHAPPAERPDDGRSESSAGTDQEAERRDSSAPPPSEPDAP